MTHDELVAISAKWLRKHQQNIIIPNCTVVASDMHTVHLSRPDVLGFNSDKSVLLEIKVNRSDFVSDKQKRARIDPEKEVGEFRYYVCPYGLIFPDEIPTAWGLIYCDDKGKMTIEKIGLKFSQFNLSEERSILMSLLRRAGIKGDK